MFSQDNLTGRSSGGNRIGHEYVWRRSRSLSAPTIGTRHRVQRARGGVDRAARAGGVGDAYPLIAAVLLAGAAFRSMQFTAITTVQFAEVPESHMADANALAAMLQQLMTGIGVAVDRGC